MTLPVHTLIVGTLTLTTIAALSTSDVCLTGQPIVNTDFEIICSKSESSALIEYEVEVICHTAQGWFNFPDEKLGLEKVTTAIFSSCSFPPDLSLFNVTTNLSQGDVKSLQFRNSQSSLSRENLKGFAVTNLTFYNNSFNELPSDLFYDVNLDEVVFHFGDLTSLPKGFFRNSTNLRNVEIMYNELTKLKRDDFSALRNVIHMLLVNNKIDEIEPGTFDNLTSLRVLDISNNRLKTLPAEIFKNLVNLEKIHLSKNDFENLPADLLHTSSQLWKVRLNHNRGGLLALPSGFFGNLSKVKYVELTNNNFSSIPDDVFSGASSLESLNLSRNSLDVLPQKIFADTISLRELQLSENKLRLLPGGLLKESNLERLHLNYNQLANFTSGSFTGLGNLKVLEASHNNLTHIDYDAFKPIENVEYINLSHNELNLTNQEIYPLSIFGPCAKIIYLDLSYNNISEIFYDLHLKASLRNLNLEGNQFRSLAVEDFSALHHLDFNFRHNKISAVNLSDIEEVARNYRSENPESPEYNLTLHLENNPLNCDCDLLQLFRYSENKLSKDVNDYVHIKTDDLRCAAPPEFNNTPITEIHSEELKCLVTSNAADDACSEMCDCWDYPGKDVLSVDCSSRNLTRVPLNVRNEQNRSIELNLSGNKFRDTPSLNHSYLLNVTALDLSSNNISRVSVRVFSRCLRDLKLHDNKISRLNPRVIQYLANNASSLRNLTLHSNQWICDCDAREFLSVIQKKLTVLELHEVTCYGTNLRLSNLTVNELCESTVAIIVGVSLVIAVFGIIVGWLVALYYRYQKEIKIWLYSKHWCLWFVTEDELDRDKQYDAFISFSHKDEDFVVKNIVAKLEEGPRPYKLCLHYRDWLAGEWIPAQIARSVNDSRRTIVVLSPDFLESVWGIMEFRTAHSQALSEGRARVIVILYGDIGDTDNLDEELKAYLRMNTYVKWGDPWFWDKLRYALPHRLEASRRRTRNARIIENHLAQAPVNSALDQGSVEAIAMPKLAKASNDSDCNLLDSGAEDERMVAAR